MKKCLFIGIIVVFSVSSYFAVAAPTKKLPTLLELQKKPHSISVLDWKILNRNIYLMQSKNYPSKPTFMMCYFDKKEGIIIERYEIRKTFLQHYQTREDVVSVLKQDCEIEAVQIPALFPLFDRSSNWLKIVFSQQGGGDGRDIAVFENNEFKVLIPEKLTPKK